MADETKYAFVASEKLSKKIDELKEELGLETTAEVISMALAMLELSLGHDVTISSKSSRLRTTKFSKFSPTVELDEPGS